MSTGWVAAGTALVGAAANASASKKAAGAQTAGASGANSLTQEQFNATRQANRPFQQTGLAANNILAALMGTADDIPDRTYEDLMAELGPNYFDYGRITGKKYNHPEWADPEIKRILKEQEERKAQVAAMKESGQFGSLLKQFGQEDLDNDVIYKNGFNFALDEGRKGLERMAAATGGTQNGKTLKALTRFGAQTANQWGNDAYNRFNTNKTNTYNMLAGQAGTGQMAVNQVASAGQNAAQSMGNNLVGMGNARAASAIGSANAISGAIGQGYNMYQQNRLYNNLMDQ